MSNDKAEAGLILTVLATALQVWLQVSNWTGAVHFTLATLSFLTMSGSALWFLWSRYLFGRVSRVISLAVALLLCGSLTSRQAGVDFAREPHDIHPEIVITAMRPLPFTAGKSTAINIFVDNKGPGTINAQLTYQLVNARFDGTFTPATIMENVNRIWAMTMKVDGMGERKNVNFNMTEGTQQWVTMTGPPLSKEDAAKLKRQHAFVVAVGALRWKGHAGPIRQEFCRYTASDPTVVFNCHEHNGLVADPEQ
jgi:hypothetical protein